MNFFSRAVKDLQLISFLNPNILHIYQIYSHVPIYRQ